MLSITRLTHFRRIYPRGDQTMNIGDCQDRRSYNNAHRVKDFRVVPCKSAGHS